MALVARGVLDHGHLTDRPLLLGSRMSLHNAATDPVGRNKSGRIELQQVG